MTTKTFARIQDGLVAEMLTTASDITSLFNPALVWLDVSSVAGVSPGWTYKAGDFAPPPQPPPAASPPTIADLQAQLAVLSQRLAALTPAS